MNKAKFNNDSKKNFDNLKYSDLNKAKFYTYLPISQFIMRCCVYPLGLIKTRMQVFSSSPNYSNIRHGLLHVFKNEGGIRGLYKGFTASVISIPAGPIFLTIMNF